MNLNLEKTTLLNAIKQKTENKGQLVNVEVQFFIKNDPMKTIVLKKSVY